MIKLQDFATRQGVTDRQIQRLLNKYAAELDGLYQRKGPSGTWLSDEACEILRGKMKQQPVMVYDDRIKALEAENKDLRDKLIAAYESMTKIQDRQLELTGQLEEQKRLAAGADSERLRADQAEERARAAEQKAEESEKQAISAVQRKVEAELALEESRERAETAEQIAEAAGQEAERAKADAAELQAKLDRLANAGWFERRRILQDLKKGERDVT